MEDYDNYADSEMFYENKFILRNCMKNSYDFLMGYKTLEELLDQDGNPYFLWNVVDHDSLTRSTFDDILDVMIKYYEDNEEYEKCAKILKFKTNGENKHRAKAKETYRVGEEGV